MAVLFEAGCLVVDSVDVLLVTFAPLVVADCNDVDGFDAVEVAVAAVVVDVF